MDEDLKCAFVQPCGCERGTQGASGVSFALYVGLGSVQFYPVSTQVIVEITQAEMRYWNLVSCCGNC